MLYGLEFLLRRSVTLWVGAADLWLKQTRVKGNTPLPA